jgi:hypothetical protein
LLNGVPALQAQTSLYNYYSGGAGNLTGTGYYNTANGFQALSANTTGSNNTANGLQALSANTTGFDNTAYGYQALSANTTGINNTANGLQALSANTTGSYNIANGFQAGRYIADGVTANQTSSNSVYEGFQAYPLASGDTNENVIGNTAIGHGSNTTTLGNSTTTGTYYFGSLNNANGPVIPLTALGYQGPAAGYVQLSVSGATNTITGTALTATCDSGTVSVTGAVVGHPVAVSSTTGADVGGAFNVRGSVTSTGTVTVYVCGTGTPASLAYNVTVF